MKIQHADIYRLSEYADHLRRLPREDKISRFGYMASDYNIDQFILSMLKHHQDHKLWAADIDGKTVGWGHLAKNTDGSWEIAVSVDHDYQRRGVANELINTMLRWAKIHHVHEVYMHCIENNRAIQHLATKNDLKTRARGDGERTAAIELPEPTIFEITDERLQRQTEIFKEIGELRTELTMLWTPPFLK